MRTLMHKAATLKYRDACGPGGQCHSALTLRRELQRRGREAFIEGALWLYERCLDQEDSDDWGSPIADLETLAALIGATITRRI